MVNQYRLLAGKRQRDVPTAGTTAIHTRQDRGSQSLTYDRTGQFEMVVIAHAGDQADFIGDKLSLRKSR
jgi:hypothetical protein